MPTIVIAPKSKGVTMLYKMKPKWSVGAGIELFIVLLSADPIVKVLLSTESVNISGVPETFSILSIMREDPI